MSIRKNLEQRAQEAILNNLIENYKQRHVDLFKNQGVRKNIFERSFYSLTNALILFFFIIAFGILAFFVLPGLGFSLMVSLIIALVAVGIPAAIVEGLYIFSRFRDGDAHAQVVAELLKPKVNFQPSTIQDERLQEKVSQALEYWSLIDETIQKAPSGVLRDRLLKTAQEVINWLQAVYNLANRVDKFRLNKVIDRDLKRIPDEINDYKRRLKKEDSLEVQQQLERTIADKERQLKTLQSLDDNMEKASYQLDSTLSSLGTIYSQLLLVGSKEEEGGRLSRLQDEISEQVHQLEDLTEAMDEVYRSSV